MKRKIVYFTAPRQVELRQESLSTLGADEILLETLCSAISAGTEMLVYRDCFSRDLEIDSVISTLRSRFEYPLAYGYACVGKVVDVGSKTHLGLVDQFFFSFQPHASHFIAKPDELFPIPDTLTLESACFLPNMETAVNLVQDAAPILGERVMVFGQGIVGLLTAALLHEFPLEALVSADRFEQRRKASLDIGVTASLDPASPDYSEMAASYLRNGADLAFELSGHPETLNDAIALTTFSGRIVIGSWYGDKTAPIDLGGAFHRSRIKLISSQVSTLAPELSGRWNKSRRFSVAWNALARIRPERWITQRFSIDDASQAYELLDKSPQKTMQVIFTY